MVLGKGRGPRPAPRAPRRAADSHRVVINDLLASLGGHFASISPKWPRKIDPATPWGRRRPAVWSNLYLSSGGLDAPDRRFGRSSDLPVVYAHQAGSGQGQGKVVADVPSRPGRFDTLAAWLLERALQRGSKSVRRHPQPEQYPPLDAAAIIPEPSRGNSSGRGAAW